MQCPYCGNDVLPGVSNCPSCGAGVPENVRQTHASSASVRPASSQQAVANGTAKSQIAYILLAVFFGCLGVHDFYAGYNGKGVAQLLITVLSCGTLCWISWIWAFIEICTVNQDAKGISFV